MSRYQASVKNPEVYKPEQVDKEGREEIDG